MSQATAVLPTSGIVSGVSMAQKINATFDAFRTMYSGASAPSADAPEYGQLWLNTTNNSINFYDGTNWILLYYLDLTNHLIIPQVGGDTQTIASASTTTLGGSSGAAAAFTTISGITGITSFGSSAILGQTFFLTFSGALTITYNATSMILPGQANITTAAGDMAIVVYLGSGNWRMMLYQPIAAVIGAASSITGAFITSNVITPTQITSNQNDYSPTGAANATIWELTTDGLSDYLITGISASQSAGRRILIRNKNAAGGGRIYFPNQSTSSSAANRFQQAGVVQLNPQQQVEFIYDTNNVWVPQNVIVAQPPAGARKNLIAGNATVPNFTAPASPLTGVKITADALVLADADGNTVNLQNVSVTAQSSVTGANGLDSTAGVGLATKTWYSGWVIYNPITNTAAGLISTSVSSPTLPSGYTFKARCTWAYTGSTASATGFASIAQRGNHADYISSANIIIPNTVSTGQLNINSIAVSSVSAFAPPTALTLHMIYAINGTSTWGAIAPLSSAAYGFTNAVPFGTLNCPPMMISDNDVNIKFGILNIMSTTFSHGSVQFQVTGWDDNL